MRRATKSDPNNRGVIKRVRALEVGMAEVKATQASQGETLNALKLSDDKRTTREQTVYTMITRVFPAVAAVLAAGAGYVAWLIKSLPHVGP